MNLILPFMSCEIYNKEPIINLCNVQSESISQTRMSHIRIPNISLIFVPSMSCSQIVIVDLVQQVEFV